MANPYTTPDIFQEWLPQKYVAELSQDDGSFNPADPVIQKGLDYGASMLESKLDVRDDIPIPAVNADDSVPESVQHFVHVVALHWLFERRAVMTEEVRHSFDVQMTWIHDVTMRRANIRLKNKSERVVTPTNERPVYQGNETRKFDNFSF